MILLIVCPAGGVNCGVGTLRPPGYGGDKLFGPSQSTHGRMAEHPDAELTDVRIEQEDHVAEVIIDNEDSLNSVDLDVIQQIGDATEWASTTSGVHVVVLRGAGEHFSSGGNIDWLADRAENRPVESWREAVVSSTSYGTGITDATLDCVKPIITKVRGNALGAGGTLATLGDIVVAESDARIGDLHIMLGLVPPNAVGYWPTLISTNKAKELLMRGETISGAEAERIGLVNHAVPAAELDDTVDEIATDLAEGPQHAIQLTKRVITRLQQRSMLTVRPEAHALEAFTAQFEDHRTALRSLQEDMHESIDFPSTHHADE